MLIVHAWESLNETFEARASEWCLGAATCTLALVSFLNVDLFKSPGFDRLADVAAQQTWAWIFLVFGGARITVLLINGAYWRTPLFRALLAFFTAGLWFQLTWGVAANWSFGIALMPWLFVLDTYNALRAGREAGVAQFLHKQKKDLKSGRLPEAIHHG